VVFGQLLKSKEQVFPPASEPDLKFVSFLDRYPSVVRVIRRKGSDVLVIPANRPELLFSSEQAFSIRLELFKAFTNFRAPKDPWYERTLEEVVWREPGAKERGDFVKIPRATEESELELRRLFLPEVEDLEVRKRVQSAIASQNPFREFTSAVRAESLQRRWHLYRSRAIANRLIEWASGAGIAWKDEWFVPLDDATRSRSVIRRFEADLISEVLSGLEGEDLDRVMVPLNLVLKILQGKRHR